MTVILRVIQRPRMCYHDLEDVLYLMHGHAVAFAQIYEMNRADFFNDNFETWLLEKTEESVADGWARAIKRIAVKRNIDVEGLFAELVQEFLAQWNTPDRTGETDTARSSL